MGSSEYDFAGWASKNNIRCGDGRVIRPNAFASDNGKTVPLVYQHDHNNLDNVIGTATLENRPEGVYCYGKFNTTPNGQLAKTLVHDGSLNRLSIYANHLQQQGGDVNHGMIREVSLVLAGANPGAVVTNPSMEHGEVGEVAYADIESPIIEHSDGSYGEVEDEAIITMPYHLVLDPQEDNKMTNDTYMQHADDGKDNSKDQQQASGDDKTVQEVFDSLTDEQKQVVYFLIGKALESQGQGGEQQQAAAQDGFNEGDELMHSNVFDNQGAYTGADHGSYELSQDDFNEIKDSIQSRGGRLSDRVKDFALAHADDYGIKDIEQLFPDAKDITNEPTFIKRETDWVAKVVGGTKHSPFSRIRMRFADITADEARAKGYIKGNKKTEEVFTLLHREVEPTTIYKKQKIDRDDVIDITSFDVITYIKGEMRIMLDEEIARAILVGDGRPTSSNDKIKEDRIIPIAKDDDFYSIKKEETGATLDDVAKTFVDDHVIAMDDYKGSGNTTMFIRQDLFTRLMLLKDGQGYRLYKSVNELASALMVNTIQKVPNEILGDVYSITVDPKDYTCGADKGGEINFFDDFDIDYNQMKYLYETRMSGALTVPKSAIVMKKKAATSPAG